MAKLYHGTTANFKRFIKSKLHLDIYHTGGVYFTRDKDFANKFTNEENEKKKFVVRDDSNMRLLKINQTISSGQEMDKIRDKLYQKGYSKIEAKIKKLALSNNKNALDHRIIDNLINGVSIRKLENMDWSADRMEQLNGRFDKFDMTKLNNVVNLLGYDGIDFRAYDGNEGTPMTVITNLKKLNKRIGTQYKGR